MKPSAKDYREHLNKNADLVKPAELPEWCAKVSPFRVKRVVETLKRYKPKTARVLDLGCGIGLNTVGIAMVFPKTTAIDVDKEVVKPTKEFLKKFGLRVPVLAYDGKKLPFENNSFDLITCVEVFEHAPNYDKLLKEAARVLKPDGVMYITAPNKWWPIEGHYQLLFLAYLPRKIADVYVRLFKKGPGYENIYLVPTYKQFYDAVSKYFEIEDITFESVINYKKLGTDKERGEWVKWLASVLKLAGRVNWLNRLLLNLSIGWLFVARPKK